MGGTPGAAVRFKITLDSVSGAFAISDDANLINRTGNLSATSLASIRYIGFSVYRAASGDVSNLSLSFTPSVPEPGTLVLGLMAGVPGLALLRRNRRIVRGRRSPRLVSAETVIGPGNCC